MIAVLAYAIFFKGQEKPHEYVRVPKWLEEGDHYEVDSLVNAEDLSGPLWMQYNYHKLHQYKDAKVVFNDLKAAADAGEPQAKFKLARCYEKGIGCKADFVMAFNLLKEAMSSQNKDVLVKLGVYYVNVEQNQEKAIELWEQAAEGENGHPFAKNLLAEHYTKEFKTIGNKELAKKIIAYHKQAADHPSGAGWKSAYRLNAICVKVRTALLRRDSYNELHAFIADRDKMRFLDQTYIDSIIFILAEDFPAKGDAAFSRDQLTARIDQISEKYSNCDNRYISQHDALLQRPIIK